MSKKIKSKLKSLFTIPEEDLKEEPSKIFEKVKLFTLTRTNIFLTITAFFIIANILVGFNLNYFYIRVILGFLFIITIPGLLFMLVFKIRTIKFWEYLVYTIGLSISFIMFAGLAINWILPWLNITDKPLSLWPILICFDIFLVILGAWAWYRNRDLKPFDITTPKLDWINNVFFIVPMFFPVLSVLGAFLLNNHGSNILTMTMLGGIAVYVLCLVLFRKRFNENIWPWAILLMSISLLLSFSLRSWFISGWDISQETYVFKLTLNNSFWSINNWNNAYNSCLSLSILPTIIKLFVSSNINIIFKLLFQIIFVFHSLVIFLIFRKYLSPILSFISSFLYFGAFYFNSWFPALIRQEIAILFFSLMLLILFSKKISSLLKKIMFITFGFSMIVSHYSTSYIALTIFIFTYILMLIYKAYEHKKIKRGKLHPDNRTKFHLTGVLVLLLLIFAFLWLTQLTSTSNGIVSTVKTTFKNIGSTFSFDLKESSVEGALFGSSGVAGYTNQELNNYINETRSSFNYSNSYSEPQTQVYSPEIVNPEIISPNNQNLVYFLSYLYKFIKYLIILSFILGSLFIFLNREKTIDKEFSFMIMLSVIFMFLIILLPFVSKAYNFERLFQQCLIFLSFSSIIFFRKVLKKYKKIFFFFIILLYLGYTLFNLGFLLPLSGGSPTLNLYNQGSNYNSVYAHNEEVVSINWFNKNNQINIVYMDPYSELKFYDFGNLNISIDNKIIPLLMTQQSYAYSNYANKIKNLNHLDAEESFNNGIVLFNFPTEFLNYNKNKIYNNGGSEIFK